MRVVAHGESDFRCKNRKRPQPCVHRDRGDIRQTRSPGQWERHVRLQEVAELACAPCRREAGNEDALHVLLGLGQNAVPRSEGQVPRCPRREERRETGGGNGRHRCARCCHVVHKRHGQRRPRLGLLSVHDRLLQQDTYFRQGNRQGAERHRIAPGVRRGGLDDCRDIRPRRLPHGTRHEEGLAMHLHTVPRRRPQCRAGAHGRVTAKLRYGTDRPRPLRNRRLGQGT